jgi:outer membrane protein assembly factor BamB/predicted Ser/Thr protein kinase
VESDELTQRLRDAASSLEASAPTYPPDELVPGTFVGRFVIVRKAGEGGLGRVYVAYDHELDRKVALKLLKTRLRGGPGGAREFLRREAQAMARLAHPNVVGVYEVGLVGDDIFVAMEYVAGRTLREWLRLAPRPRPAILEVFLQAGEGLLAAHRAGLVHRDFKPDNVIVGDDGRVRVLDFGLAERQRHAPDDATDDETGATRRVRNIVGTPAYMAPEVLDGGPADARSDLFGYCVALHEALCAARPFRGGDLDALRDAIVAGEIHEPPDRRLPGRLRRILRKGLAADPALRTPDMAALLAELRRDPRRRALAAARGLAVAAGLAASGYAVHLATRPGVLEVHVVADHRPLAPARVTVDGRPLPPTADGARGEVPAGLHRLRIDADDHESREDIVELEHGQRLRLTETLVRARGFFDLEVQPPGATILIDDVDHGSRLRNLPVPTGDHELRLLRPGDHGVRLRWRAAAGEVTSGYVSLDRAVVWARQQSGVAYDPRWLGDVDGDGAPDLFHRYFHVLAATDPWHDRDHWQLSLAPASNSLHALLDLDGDDLPELLTVDDEDHRAHLRAFSTAPAGGREPALLWAHRGGRRQTTHPEPALLAAGDRRLVVVGGVTPGRVEALDARSGAPRWHLDLGAEVEALVVADDHLVVAAGGRLTALDADGRPLWPPAPAPLASRPRAVDPRTTRRCELDGDDHPDLLLTELAPAAPASLRAVAGADGHPLWAADVRPLPFDSSPAVGDADADGRCEAVVVQALPDPLGDEALVALDGDGATRWRAPTRRVLGVAWLALDAGPVVAVTHDHGVDLRAAADGRLLGEVATDAPPTTLPVGVDWDGDGRRDVMVGTARRELVAHAPDGEWLGSVLLAAPPQRLWVTGDRSGDGVDDLLVQGNGPLVVTGRRRLWQRGATDAIRVTPVVADLDGDGDLELAAFGGFTDVHGLHLFDAASGRLVARGRESPYTLRPPTLLPRADGGADLLVIDRAALRRFAGRDAAQLAEVEIPPSYSTPTVADLDGDGHDEVVVLPWAAGPLELRALDDLARRASFDLPDGGWARPVAADLDADARPELVLGLHDGLALALDLAAGRLRERWRRDLGGRILNPPTVADLDADGRPELLATAHAGERQDLVLLAGDDGRELWRRPGEGGRLGAPQLHDLDGDGAPEILVATHDRGVAALDLAGAVRWRFLPAPAAPAQPPVSAPPALADLDADGVPELLVPLRDGVLFALDVRDGRPRWRYTTDDPTIEPAPVARDIDGDGLAEVVLAGHDRQLRVLRGLPRR